MADKPSSEKTEQPTPRRLKKAREEGQVPTSMEFSSALVLAALLLTLYLTGTQLLQWFSNQLREGLACDPQVFASHGAFVDFFGGKIQAAMWAMAPLLAAFLIAGAVGNLALSGWSMAPKAMRMRLDGLDPIRGFKNLFSSRALVNLLLSIAKLLVIGLIVYFYLRSKLTEIVALRWVWSTDTFVAIGQLMFGVVVRILVAMFVMAVLDAVYQRYKYRRELMMTKQEVKEERRQDEGAPEIKRRVRMVQFEMVRKRMMQQVPKANVVLVNPTHVAVALKYDSKEMNAPVVVAKGGDIMAEKIKEVARIHGIPIITRRELARTIYDTVKIDHPIPEALYVAVAEILAVIHRLRKRRQ